MKFDKKDVIEMMKRVSSLAHHATVESYYGDDEGFANEVFEEYIEEQRSEAVSAVKTLVIRLKCRILGHNYYFIKELSDQCDQVGCKRCGKKFGMNHSIRVLLPWDRELEKFYEDFRDFKDRILNV